MDAFDIRRFELRTARDLRDWFVLNLKIWGVSGFCHSSACSVRQWRAFTIGEFTKKIWMLLLLGFIRRCFRHSGNVSFLWHPGIWLTLILDMATTNILRRTWNLSKCYISSLVHPGLSPEDPQYVFRDPGFGLFSAGIRDFWGKWELDSGL